MIKIIAYFLFFACINANQLKVPSQYSTIQAAIDAASEGDTVFVAAGSYNENITTNSKNNLYLLGEDPRTTIIIGNFDIIGHHITIDGFTLRGGEKFRAYDGPWLEVKRSIFEEFTGLLDFQTSTIENCLFTNNSGYLQFSGRSDKFFTNRVINSTITGNKEGFSIEVYFQDQGSSTNYWDTVFLNSIINIGKGRYDGPTNSYRPLNFWIEEGGSINAPRVFLINNLISDSVKSSLDAATWGSSFTVNNTNSIVSTNKLIDELFIDHLNNNFNLKDWSNSIGSGIIEYVIDDTTIKVPTSDILGYLRPNPSGSKPDLGAFENKWGAPQNATPAVAALSDKIIKEDESITVIVSATDYEGDAITFSTVHDTTLTVSISSDTLTITPKLNWHGVASVIVYASDGNSKGQALFDVTVTSVNDLPTAFEWVSGALDTINITKTNLATNYKLEWTTSKDEADGDTIDYLLYAGTGTYPKVDVYDTTSTTVLIPYQAFLENTFEQIPMLSGATVRFSVYAHDGTDSVKVTGNDRVVYVNRYEYLSTLDDQIPTDFALHENYPNPFNPTTTLRFDLPEVSDVNVVIYNMLGQKVRTFNMNSISAGSHSIKWN
ncbi:MAG: hypothetical protein CMG45_05630, partial [Candidatus Marinimicrobia bacterium]|nr:hypothetical protein [Candidatus Neomarinimicrobiota bacterium]